MAMNIVNRIDNLVGVRHMLVSVSDKSGLDTFVPQLVADAEAAMAAASKLGYPIVLKGHGAKLAHKSELGLVRVGLVDDDAVVVGEQDRLFKFWKMLFEGGLFTNPVTGPAVPPGMDLIRSSYMATHTRAHCDRVLEIFAAAGREVGLIGEDAQPVRLAR